MFTSFNAFFARALVAVLLLAGTGTGTALAGPIYRVTVDTSAWSGDGYLDLTLAGVANTVPVIATLSNFTGSFGSASYTLGQVTGNVASMVRLAQGPSFNELLQGIGFGGTFSFDVGFEMPAGALDGSTFGVALVNAGLSAYAAGTNGDIATIALMPGAANVAWADQRFASIAEVPEPGSAAIFALGLLLVGCGSAGARRRPGLMMV